MSLTDEVKINGFISIFRMADALGDLIESNKVKLDVGGHFNSGKRKLDKREKEHIIYRIKSTGATFGSVEQEDCEYLLAVMDGKQKASKWINLGHSCLFECDICGEEVKLQFNGKKLRCVNPCAYPNGFPHYSVEINIPSGKMVAANDLRQWWKIVGDYNVNKVINCKRSSDKYAEQGMAHMFVSNTSWDL